MCSSRLSFFSSPRRDPCFFGLTCQFSAGELPFLCDFPAGPHWLIHRYLNCSPHPLTCANACICDASVPCDIGFPIISHFTKKIQTTGGGFNLGGTNATGQVPVMPGQRGLIDKDTPLEVYSKKSWMNPSQEMILVFSDEFNEDGRTFYPGDDPYWEAVDLHYWVTVRTLAFFGLCVCVWSERGVDGMALLFFFKYL